MPLAATTETLPPLAALRLERDRFVALAFSWADILIEIDDQRRIVFAAGATDAALGRPVAGLLGAGIDKLIVTAHRARLDQALANRGRRERSEVVTINLATNDGSAPFVLATCHLPDLDGHDFLALRQLQPVAPRPVQRACRNRDDVSGLCTSQAFSESVSRELVRNGGDSEINLSLFVICGFNELRARMTQEGARSLTGAIGDNLRANAIDDRMAGRLGDDRFTLAHCGDLDLSTVESKLTALTRAADPDGRGAEIGRATIPLAGGGQRTAAGGHNAVLEYALGRFRHVEARPGAVQALSRSFAVLAEQTEIAVRSFQTMVAHSDFEIVFQPVLHSRGGRVFCYEALARLPERYGARPLTETIRFAEAVGMITDFDAAMLSKAVAWLANNTPLKSKLRLAINISGQSVNSLSFLAHVERTLRRNPWMRGQLMFEITHSSRITDFAAANQFIKQMRGRGLQVSLGDFGNLATNFQHLAMLDVDMVKIDAGVVHYARFARRGRAFLNSFVGLCRDLSIATVAERIEDQASHAFVRDCGVAYVQGYLFGAPSADIAALTRSIPRHLFETAADQPSQSRLQTRKR